jgi:hypothetical protein
VRLAAVFLIFAASLTGVLGCAPGNGAGGDGEIEVKPAPIHELEVRFAESFPVQVFVYIKGGLADGCTSFHGLEITERAANRIKMEVTVERPKDAVCPAVYGFFEQNVNLGTDFKSGQTYTVIVNDRSTTFVMQ